MATVILIGPRLGYRVPEASKCTYRYLCQIQLSCWRTRSFLPEVQMYKTCTKKLDDEVYIVFKNFKLPRLGNLHQVTLSVSENILY